MFFLCILFLFTIKSIFPLLRWVLGKNKHSDSGTGDNLLCRDWLDIPFFLHNLYLKKALNSILLYLRSNRFAYNNLLILQESAPVPDHGSQTLGV
jgi:hypothetical protein